MKKKLPYILSFIIPLLILSILFVLNGVLTGKYIGLVSDSNGQYYDFFVYLKSILNTGDFYSFENGAGGSVFGILSYYLASPLNLLIKFIPEHFTAIFMMILIIFKISLSGLSMFIFLNYHFKNNKYLYVFSSCYALSLYNIANYFQIMWLDAIFLAPLVLLGIDKLIKDNNNWLYPIMLFLTILCNYYMGYMVCLFSIIYFIYRVILNKTNKRVIIKFIVLSLLAGLLTSFLTVPTFLEIINTGRFNHELSNLFNFDIVKNISKSLFDGYNYKEVINKTYGYFYVGLIVYPLVYFYFVNKNIDKKEKRFSLIILAFFACSIIFQPLNILWHAFSAPIGFNYRYLFLLNIFVIFLAVKSFDNFDKFPIIYYLLYMIFFVYINVLVYIYEQLSLFIIVTNILIMLVYLILLYNLKKKNVFVFIILIGIIFELSLNAFLILKSYIYFESNTFNGVYQENGEVVSLTKRLDDSQFYRTELATTQYNDSLYLKYNSLSSWTSTIDAKAVTFFHKIGFQNNLMNYRYSQNYVTDSLLGLKYVLNFNKINNYKLLNEYSVSSYNKLLNKNVKGYFYENPYYLSLGYIVKENSELNCDDPFICQNQLLDSMTGYGDIYDEEQINNIEDEYSFMASNKTAYLYIDIDDFNYEVYVNGKLNNRGIDTLNNIIVLNDLKIGKIVNVKVVPTSYFKVKDIKLYSLDFNKFKECYNALKKNELEITTFNNENVIGNISLKEDGLLFTSIPYNNGFDLYVDGKKVKIEKMYDTFIGINLEKGDHIIEFKYKVRGLKVGLSLSALSVFLLFIYIKKEKN